MSTEDSYKKKLNTITAIPEDHVQLLVTMPITKYIQEAEDLFKWCREDKAALTARGLPWDLVTDLPTRIGALRQAETLWRNKRGLKGDTEKQWLEKSAAAYRLRNEMLTEFRFAYRKHPEIMAVINTMSPGKGHSKMIQDLNGLGKMGEEHPEPLEQAGIDMTLPAKARTMVDELAPLHGEIKRLKTRSQKTHTIRDQAFTHLKEAVDEIRRYGRHIFRDNKKRKKGYKSEYLHRRNNRRRNNKKNASADENTAPIPTDIPTDNPTDEEKRRPNDVNLHGDDDNMQKNADVSPQEGKISARNAKKTD